MNTMWNREIVFLHVWFITAVKYEDITQGKLLEMVDASEVYYFDKLILYKNILDIIRFVIVKIDHKIFIY